MFAFVIFVFFLPLPDIFGDSEVRHGLSLLPLSWAFYVGLFSRLMSTLIPCQFYWYRSA
jgi:hypothetical protein